MAPNKLYELFAKGESGKITEAELSQLTEAQKSDANKVHYEEFEKLLNKKEIYNTMPNFNYKRTRKKIITEIQKQEPEFTMGERKSIPVISFIKRSYKVAAVFLLVLAVGSAVLFNRTTDNANSVEIVYREFSTKPGENLKIDLPDGSFVQLNGGSNLRFAEKFSETKREIWISGEAYCEVAKDRKRPFVVSLDGYNVEVLGTTFNINAYPEDENLSVALVEGKVKVGQPKGGDIFLDPGKMVSFNKQTREYVKTMFDINEQLGWKNKVFHFNNTPLPEVYKQLERRYGVSFQTGGIDVSEIRVNASFNNASFLTVITAIEEGTELSYDIRENKKIIVSKK